MNDSDLGSRPRNCIDSFMVAKEVDPDIVVGVHVSMIRDGISRDAENSGECRLRLGLVGFDDHGSGHLERIFHSTGRHVPVYPSP